MPLLQQFSLSFNPNKYINPSTRLGVLQSKTKNKKCRKAAFEVYTTHYVLHFTLYTQHSTLITHHSSLPEGNLKKLVPLLS
jgi:hypothetical protein